MTKATIKNFKLQKLDNSQGLLDLARKKWANAEFVPNDDYWLASFELNGEKNVAGIRAGHRIDVAADIVQYDIQLNIRDEAFEADSFIPEGEVADVLFAVQDEFQKATQRAWEKSSLDDAMKAAVGACLRGDRLIVLDASGADLYSLTGEDDPKRVVLVVRVDRAQFEARDCRKALDDAHAAYLSERNK